ncbi:hypothetical protein ASD11_13615 [Aeromicrobium sp. Root495]|uniref:alpha/beta hydrolase n=1 Tax=Aeromicrobium sp. Root495 TaxID=1736550 RepID=UPI0006F5DA68|nr:alpha/beta hydrolase [Aeromicrobium sp. Root495]KQY60478.1 hypothetical protein ASD11_13615 [Aeromicrobium sp. Root495]RYJ01944.1 MAG: alpha/beta hydrolase [Actinomycetales bacterium]
MTQEYAPGRLVDVVGEGPTVLLWHGRGPDNRLALTRLAAAVAASGRRVVVPDWDSTHEDGGRSDLLSSLRFARETADDDPDQLTLLGWSLGGIAAASLTLNQRRLGIGLARTVLVAAGAFPYDDPISGAPVGPAKPPVQRTTTVAFVHALRDELIATEDVHRAHADWSQAGWPVTLRELDADHFSIVEDTADEVASIVLRPPPSWE